MRWLSEDNKRFNTKQECCDYEQKIEKVRNKERIEKDKLEIERQSRFKEICKIHKELQELIEEYQRDYYVEIKEYLTFSEISRVLYL